MLKGKADTYSIPVITSSDTPQGDLTGSATEATPHDAYSGYTLYILTKDNGKAQFNPCTSGDIGAGKAFLKVDTSTTGTSEAKALNVVINDESTGIQTVQDTELKVSGEYYNLNGQRVSNPTKGLYIVNGKKVLVK